MPTTRKQRSGILTQKIRCTGVLADDFRSLLHLSSGSVQFAWVWKDLKMHSLGTLANSSEASEGASSGGAGVATAQLPNVEGDDAVAKAARDIAEAGQDRKWSDRV